MRTVRYSGRIGGEVSAQGGCTPPPVDRILDTRLCKHYITVTTVADGN